jgi:hypothetical protein
MVIVTKARSDATGTPMRTSSQNVSCSPVVSSRSVVPKSGCGSRS